MSECSKYQLFLQTDYVRRREKYDYLYIHSHNTILNCPQGISQLFFETKDSCPVECSDAVVRQSLPAKQWLTETRRISYRLTMIVPGDGYSRNTSCVLI